MKFSPQIVDLMAVAVMVALFYRFSHSMRLFALLTLPATVAHEIAHWIVSLSFNGKPSGFTVWPQQSNGGWTMGSVTSSNATWYNAALIALAPLLLLPLAYVTYVYWLAHTPIWSWLHGTGLYLIATLIEGALPSLSDMRLAAHYPAPLLIAAAVSIAWVCLR